MTLAAVGDIMMDKRVQMSAKRLVNPAVKDPRLRVASGFERLFTQVKDRISQADIVFANLETPIAERLSRRRSLS